LALEVALILKLETVNSSLLLVPLHEYVMIIWFEVTTIEELGIITKSWGGIDL
jgi:hypothetical protein